MPALMRPGRLFREWRWEAAAARGWTGFWHSSGLWRASAAGGSYYLLAPIGRCRQAPTRGGACLAASSRSVTFALAGNLRALGGSLLGGVLLSEGRLSPPEWGPAVCPGGGARGGARGPRTPTPPVVVLCYHRPDGCYRSPPCLIDCCPPESSCKLTDWPVSSTKLMKGP